MEYGIKSASNAEKGWCSVTKKCAVLSLLLGLAILAVLSVLLVKKNEEISSLKTENKALKLAMAEAVKLSHLKNGQIDVWDGMWEKTYPYPNFYIHVTFPTDTGIGSVDAYFKVDPGQEVVRYAYLVTDGERQHYVGHEREIFGLVKNPKQ